MLQKYELIDCGEGEKLEAFGDYKIIRPAPQALWAKRDKTLWKKPDGRFNRGNTEKGAWVFYNPELEKMTTWQTRSSDDLIWNIVPNDYGNVGVFVEHWLYTPTILKFLDSNNLKAESILDLFCYSGSNAISLVKAGHKVTAVDSSRSALELYTKNLEANQLSRDGQRLIFEDCLKFVNRETRRNAKYKVILADAPSYGRGTKGEVFNIEDDFVKLLTALKEILADKGRLFFTLHSPRYTTTALKNISSTIFVDCNITVEELIVESRTKIGLPSGHLMVIDKNG